MPDEGVAAGEDQALMAVVGPAHQVWRAPVLTDFEDLGIPIEIAYVMTSNDQSITLLCMHWNLQVLLSQNVHAGGHRCQGPKSLPACQPATSAHEARPRAHCP